MITGHKKQQAIKKAERIYKEIAEDDRQLAEDFLGICAEPVATYLGMQKKGHKND